MARVLAILGTMESAWTTNNKKVQIPVDPLG